MGCRVSLESTKLDPTVARAISDNARPVVRQVLKQIRVNSFQVRGIKSPTNRILVEFSDAVRDKVAFAFLAPRLICLFPSLVTHNP